MSKGRGLTPPPSAPPTNPTNITRQAVDTGNNTSPDALDYLGATTSYSRENLHTLIFNYLNETFPRPKNRMVHKVEMDRDISVGASVGDDPFRGFPLRTDSDGDSDVSEEHIPEESDLVLVEPGIKELIGIDDYEHLIRGVLVLPNRPATVNIE